MVAYVVGFRFSEHPWPTPPPGAQDVTIHATAEFLEPRTLARRYYPGDVLAVAADVAANLVVLELAAIDVDDLPPWWPSAGSLIAGAPDLEHKVAS